MRTAKIIDSVFAFGALSVLAYFEIRGVKASRELFALFAGVVMWAAPSPGSIATTARKSVTTFLLVFAVLSFGCSHLAPIWSNVRSAALSCGSEISSVLLESLSDVLLRKSGHLDKKDWESFGDLAEKHTPEAVVCGVRKFVELQENQGGFSDSESGESAALARADEFLAKTR